MKIGLYLNPQEASEKTGQEVFTAMSELARTANAAGFDHISAGQHYLSDFTQLQLLPYLSRIAGEVTDMEIATGVILLPFHHPVDIAERLATLDSVHDGSTAFGVGAGYRDVEFDAFDVPKSERISRLVEGVELTQRLLTRQRVSYHGEHYSVDDVTIPVQPDDEIPVWMAANANPAVRRAAERSDAWFVNPHATFDEIREQKAAHYDPVRKQHGEDDAVPVMREAFVAPTYEEAVETARDHLWEKYQRYVDWGQDEAMEQDSTIDLPFDALAEDRFLLGSPAEVCEAAARYNRELNASHLILRCHWPGLPTEAAKTCIKRIGDEVIPNI